jgi:integrase
MTIDKLPSGSYRIRHMEKGTSYCITVKHKPTKAEAMKLMSERIDRTPTSSEMTVKDACKAYLDAKHNVLSPSTRKEYTATAERLPKDFTSKYLSQVTSIMVQKVINDYAATLSPKTVANYAHFISAVLKSQDIEIKPPKLPQKEKKSPYIPTEKDIKAVFDVIRGTEHEIPITLCCFGLRRSEVCALTLDDLDGNVLTINKAMVQDENHNWVIKTTKTTESTRTIIIPDDIADKIREKGYVYKFTPDNIYKALQRAQDKAGVHRFQLHKLRHFFASFLHQKGYTDKQIQEMGGWKTDSVMKTVYQHAMDMDKAKKKATNDIAKLF